MIADEKHPLRIAVLEDLCDLLVRCLVDAVDVRFVAIELVEDGVCLLELDEPEVRLVLVDKVAKCRTAHTDQRTVLLDFFSASESESSSRV